MKQRWQDPDDGVVHDLVVPDTTWYTTGGGDEQWRTLACGRNVALDPDDRMLLKRHGLIAVLWTTTQLPTSCIRRLAGRQADDHEDVE